MDLGDLFLALPADMPSRRSRTSEESTAELACLFLPLAELVATFFLGLGEHPLAALVLLPLALAAAAYPLSGRLGTGRGFALWMSIRTFFASLVIGGVAVLLLGFLSFFQTF